MHRMTPNWFLTLNCQKYSIYTKYYEAQIVISFALQLAVSEIQHAQG